MRFYSFTLCFLFKPNMCTNTFNKDQSNAECLSSQPSDLIDIDSISIPNDFMSFKDKSNNTENLESSIESNNQRNNRLVLDIASAFEKMSLKYLITYIKNFTFEHFYSQEGKCPVELHKFKSLIDKMYTMIYENDLSAVSSTASYVQIKISLFKIVKQLIYCVESGTIKDLNDFSKQNKKNRLKEIDELSNEFARCYTNLLKFLNECGEIEKNTSEIEQFSFDETTTCKDLHQAMEISDKSSNNSNSSNLLKSSEIYSSDSISSKRLFAYNFPFLISGVYVRSFCKSNSGIWYFVIELFNHKNLKILKIDQKDFDLNNSDGEIIKKYSTISDKGVKKVSFYRYCRKIVANPVGTLYVLQYSEKHSSFEILALNSDFQLIKKLESSSFESSGLKEIFIEDIVVYSDLLYLYDSQNECIIVTDFDFKLKHIIKAEIKFKKFKENYTSLNVKAVLNLFVTEKYFYFFTYGKIHACKNNVIGSNNADVNIIGEVLEIASVGSSRSTNFEKTVYVGNDSFISTSIGCDKYFVFTKLVSTTAPLTCESKILNIDHEVRANFASLDIAAIEDNNLYLVEGGKNIKLFNFDKKSENKN